MFPGPDESRTRAVASPDGPRASWLRVWALIGGGVAVAVAAVLVVVLVVGKDKPTGGGEIVMESAGSTGQDPFTPSVAKPQPLAAVPAAQQSPIPAQAGTPAALRTINGGEPGLYGGSRNLGSCDTGLLVNFLEQNPDKGAAWAGVLGITAPQIRDYVSQLTQVVLRADTRVTNHGFANGKAFALQSVLQAGTAVLVDKFGAPRVRCECGNPLLEPKPVRYTPVYVGQAWPQFKPEMLVVVVKITVIIDIFTLYDGGCGCYFGRPRGGDGSTDTDIPRPPPPPPPSTEYAPSVPSSAPPGYVPPTKQYTPPGPCATAGASCGETPEPPSTSQQPCPLTTECGNRSLNPDTPTATSPNPRVGCLPGETPPAGVICGQEQPQTGQQRTAAPLSPTPDFSCYAGEPAKTPDSYCAGKP
jgi:hypothetical protein